MKTTTYHKKRKLQPRHPKLMGSSGVPLIQMNKQAAKNVNAVSKLPNDVLQADTLQVINAAMSGRQLLEVSNVAKQKQLESGNGSGAYRLGIPIIGAITNTATDGTVYIDNRGTFYDLKKVSIQFKNVFQEEIEIRLNTPYCYTIGGDETNARTSLRTKVLNPNEEWRVKLPINIHNTMRFPPKQEMALTGLDGGRNAVDITMNVIAVCDYTVIIADNPKTTGPMSTGDKASTWSPAAQVVEVESVAKVKLQTGVTVSGTTKMVEGPTLVHIGLRNLSDMLNVNPQKVIPTQVTHAEALQTLTKKKPLTAVTPNFTVITEGVYPYIRPLRVDAGDLGYRYALVETDQKGQNTAPVGLKSLEDLDIRLIGPGVVYKAAGIGNVYNEYGWSSEYSSWNLMAGDNTYYSHGVADVQDVAVWNKSIPIMYWNISREVGDHLRESFWGSVLGCIQGTVEILNVASSVMAIFM